MDKNRILENIEKLKQNAIFAMSLTSKELFHSNFWAWMLRNYKEIFTQAFDLSYNGNEEVEVYREKHHYDLSLQIGDKLLIIENKFKSMPDKYQLERYKKTSAGENAKILLVSYYKPIFKGDYEYCSYSELYNRLQKNFETNITKIKDNDKVIIKSYLEFLNLLVQFQDNVNFDDNDKICDLWAVIKDEDIQKQLAYINFGKTFERIYITKLTERVIRDFKDADKIDKIRIDCGRDLKVFSDIMFHFKGAWSKNEEERQDLCYLGISLWGNEYRYYAGLHKKQCNITAPKNGRMDKINKEAGYKYLSVHYGWFFNSTENRKWNGYSDNSQMYLYQKEDITDLTIKELSAKADKDLEQIYSYMISKNR